MSQTACASLLPSVVRSLADCQLTSLPKKGPYQSLEVNPAGSVQPCTHAGLPQQRPAQQRACQALALCCRRRRRHRPLANRLPCGLHCAPLTQQLDLSDNFLVEVPAWLPRACPRLRVLDVGFCGEEQGSYEDPAPLTLTPAVRELVTR